MCCDGCLGDGTDRREHSEAMAGSDGRRIVGAGMDAGWRRLRGYVTEATSREPMDGMLRDEEDTEWECWKACDRGEDNKSSENSSEASSLWRVLFAARNAVGRCGGSEPWRECIRKEMYFFLREPLMVCSNFFLLV
jgi:hypothetical protein